MRAEHVIAAVLTLAFIGSLVAAWAVGRVAPDDEPDEVERIRDAGW